MSYNILYWFPVTALTHYHKFDKTNFFSYIIGGEKSEMVVWAQISMLSRLNFFWRFQRRSPSRFFQLLSTARFPWLMAPSSAVQISSVASSHRSRAPASPKRLSPSVPHKEPCDYTGLTCIVSHFKTLNVSLLQSHFFLPHEVLFTGSRG